jgi:AraC-like DNA-binding protein
VRQIQVSFETAEDLSGAVDMIFNDFPVLLYYNLDSVAPYPGFQSHNGVEMYYIENGTGSYWVSDRPYPLQSGSLMIIRPYTLHKVIQTEVDRILCRNVLMWKEEFLRTNWNGSLEFCLDLMPSDCCHVQFDSAQQKRVSMIYSTIQQELLDKKNGYADVLNSLIKQLLILAYRVYEQQEQGADNAVPGSIIPDEISYLVQYIGANFHQELSLKKLSGLIHMNPTYTSSLFHKYTGTTINKFISIKRIHHAKKLLRETNLSVTDIAYQCGFNNHSYFIKMFKRMEAASPAIYRREHNKP